MTEAVKFMITAFKFLTGELKNICRLCCCVTDKVISLHESCVLETEYYNGAVTFEDMLNDLRVSLT